jgi:hypothetical protein
LADLQLEVPFALRIPECPAYWSLDPSGAECLNEEDARNHGFPDLDFKVRVGGRTWDDSVYDGIRQFQEARGLDPYSHEVPLQLGQSLYQVSGQEDALFARGKRTKPRIRSSLD